MLKKEIVNGHLLDTFGIEGDVIYDGNKGKVILCKKCKEVHQHDKEKKCCGEKIEGEEIIVIHDRRYFYAGRKRETQVIQLGSRIESERPFVISRPTLLIEYNEKASGNEVVLIEDHKRMLTIHQTGTFFSQQSCNSDYRVADNSIHLKGVDEEIKANPNFAGLIIAIKSNHSKVGYSEEFLSDTNLLRILTGIVDNSFSTEFIRGGRERKADIKKVPLFRKDLIEYIKDLFDISDNELVEDLIKNPNSDKIVINKLTMKEEAKAMRSVSFKKEEKELTELLLQGYYFKDFLKVSSHKNSFIIPHEVFNKYPNNFSDLLKNYSRESSISREIPSFTGLRDWLSILDENKTKVSAESFRKKVIQNITNNKRIKRELPEKKASLIIDLIEHNPIEAIKLLKTKRELTKKQQGEYKELL